MNARIDDIIDHVLDVEGGYVNDPDDPGGATNHGITEREARAYGYEGAMRDLPRRTARDIYMTRYVVGPRFNEVGRYSWAVAAELVDTGVNMGQADAGRFLQQCLNAFNKEARLYRDVGVDGIVGDKTLAALDAYHEDRGDEGMDVLLAALNALQGAEYIRLTDVRARNEKYVYGWIRQRVRF